MEWGAAWRLLKVSLKAYLKMDNKKLIQKILIFNRWVFHAYNSSFQCHKLRTGKIVHDHIELHNICSFNFFLACNMEFKSKRELLYPESLS